MERRNRKKARILCDLIDASGFYHCPASENCRLSVSIVFDLPIKDLQAASLIWQHGAARSTSTRMQPRAASEQGSITPSLRQPLGRLPAS